MTLAGHGFCLRGGGMARRVVQIEGMPVFFTPGAECEVEVVADAEAPMPECRWVYEFDFPEAQSHCRFGVSAAGEYVFCFDDHDFLRFDAGCPRQVHVAEVADLTRLRFLLWMAVALAGSSLGFAPVHSSVVVASGRAVLFLGESGTGKSTHTRLWQQHVQGSRLLNDDSPLLGIGADGALTVWGSPWSGKTPCYRAEAFPVAAIVRLYQHPENVVRRLSVLEAFAALQPSLPPALARDEQLLDRMVMLISRMVETVPIYSMGCRPDAQAATMCHETVMGYAGA